MNPMNHNDSNFRIYFLTKANFSIKESHSVLFKSGIYIVYAQIGLSFIEFPTPPLIHFLPPLN